MATDAIEKGALASTDAGQHGGIDMKQFRSARIDLVAMLDTEERPATLSPIVVEMIDPILHTADAPLCHDLTCPCYEGLREFERELARMFGL
jgi:hypothetical protein